MGQPTQMGISVHKQFIPLIEEIKTKRPDLVSTSEVIKEAIRELWKNSKGLKTMSNIQLSSKEAELNSVSERSNMSPYLSLERITNSTAAQRTREIDSRLAKLSNEKIPKGTMIILNKRRGKVECVDLRGGIDG